MSGRTRLFASYYDINPSQEGWHLVWGWVMRYLTISCKESGLLASATMHMIVFQCFAKMKLPYGTAAVRIVKM